MGGVEILAYNKADLKRLLADERFWMQPKLPITRSRIISHVANPRADDDDKLLITASSKGQLVAYLCILPDLVMVDRESRVKFGWLTAWWVDKGSEDRLASAIVLMAA